MGRISIVSFSARKTGNCFRLADYIISKSQFVSDLLDNLKETVAYTIQEKNRHFMPSSFKTIEISQEELDELFY